MTFSAASMVSANCVRRNPEPSWHFGQAKNIAFAAAQLFKEIVGQALSP
jgi:hypothetical protein